MAYRRLSEKEMNELLIDIVDAVEFRDDDMIRRKSYKAYEAFQLNKVDYSGMKGVKKKNEKVG